MPSPQQPEVPGPGQPTGTARATTTPTRRAVLLGAAAALAAPGLSGCGQGSSRGAGSPGQNLEYVVIEDQDWISRTTADLAAFAATGPGFRVTPRYLNSTQYDGKVCRQAFAADPPGLIWHTISRARFADLATTGAATDLTDFWAVALPGVSPDVAAWYGRGGRTYAVPLAVELYPLICYDVTVFRRLGIASPPAATRSWPEEEFLDACARLQAAGLDPLSLAGLDLSRQVVEAIAVSMLSPEELRHYTVEAWQPGSRYRYTDDLWVQVFARLQAWTGAGVFQPRAAWTDEVSAQRAFLGGMSAMVGGGSRLVGKLKVLSSASGAPPQTDWMLFPTVRHPGRLLTFPGDGAFLPVANEQREQAERLLAFMVRPDRLLAAAAAYGHLPPIAVPGLSGVLDPQVASMLEFSGRMGAPCPNWPTELEAPFARACRAVLAGSRTPQQAAQDLEDAAGLARAAASGAGDSAT